MNPTNTPSRATTSGETALMRTTIVPCTAAAIAGLCIMVVELVAGHVISGYLGQSIYTWTAVIGSILAGMSLGNYVGGRLADRYNPSRLLGLLFILAAAACFAIRPLNQVIGAALNAHDVGPARIILHVFLVFVLPGALLGTMGPVIAKSALDTGGPEGRTVGTVYACNAAGSIAGTFLTGFFLVPRFAISTIIATVAAVLLLAGLLYVFMDSRSAKVVPARGPEAAHD